MNGSLTADGRGLNSTSRPRRYVVAAIPGSLYDKLLTPVHSISISQPPVDTAVFPSPSTSFTPKFPLAPSAPGCTCEPQARPVCDESITLENISNQCGRIMRQMLAFPNSTSPHADNDPLKLPDISTYLPVNTDIKVADALAALYRTHCISVIDSFRFCKERNLFRHFSAFHGTLTVPVQKLLIHPNLAPWIKECDWLMYQKMIEFVAPLTTQVVPQPVLDSFGSISQRLTGHIAETFKAHPIHVSLSRLVPAHLFCNLLKHMLDVNQAANAAAAWLCHPDNRNQMWLDFATFVDPKEMILKANIPSCSEKATEQILKFDIRALLTPLENPTSPTVLSFYQQIGNDVQGRKNSVETSTGDEYNFPDKWISFILSLPSLFPNHPTKCIVDKVDKLWDCVLHRLTLAGAPSFSAWWMTKVFFHEMLLWQVEKGGFIKNTPGSLQNMSSANSGMENPQPRIARQGSFAVPVKNEPYINSENASVHEAGPITSINNMSCRLPAEKLANTDSRSINERSSTTISENTTGLQAPNHDDSGIGLDDDSMLMAVGKYDMMTDTADAEGDVVVI